MAGASKGVKSNEVQEFDKGLHDISINIINGQAKSTRSGETPINEGSWAKKGVKSFFGYKGHILIDTRIILSEMSRRQLLLCTIVRLTWKLKRYRAMLIRDIGRGQEKGLVTVLEIIPDCQPTIIVKFI